LLEFERGLTDVLDFLGAATRFGGTNHSLVHASANFTNWAVRDSGIHTLIVFVQASAAGNLSVQASIGGKTLVLSASVAIVTFTVCEAASGDE